MYFPHHKVESTQFINRLPCIISEELLVKTNDFIIRSGINKSTMGIWYKYKRTFTDPNKLNNEKAMEGML